MPNQPPFDFRHLSVAERLELVEDLWDSIAQDADAATLPLTDDEKRLLGERLADLEQNPDQVVSWEEVKAKLLKRGA